MQESYVQAHIISIKSNAEMGDVVHDQWIRIQVDNSEFYIFDENAICPKEYEGTIKQIKIGIMPIRVKKTTKGETGFLNNRNFICRVVKQEKLEELSSYVVDVSGVLMHLELYDEYSEGTYLEIEGRLDLIEIAGVSTRTGWKTIKDWY